LAQYWPSTSKRHEGAGCRGYGERKLGWTVSHSLARWNRSSELSEEGVDDCAERGRLFDPRIMAAVLDHGGTTIREQVG
jgi:hypothetical protein